MDRGVKKKTTTVLLRLQFPSGLTFGPRKAALLAGIRETGSIAAAGRGLQMSYKHAWYLAEELNQVFGVPLIEAVKGGAGGGGARLTKAGERALARYQRMHAACCEKIAPDLKALGVPSPSGEIRLKRLAGSDRRAPVRLK